MKIKEGLDYSIIKTKVTTRNTWPYSYCQIPTCTLQFSFCFVDSYSWFLCPFFSLFLFETLIWLNLQLGLLNGQHSKAQWVNPIELWNLGNRILCLSGLEFIFLYLFRRGIGGLPTRLINKNRAGSVQSGSAGADAESLQDESSLDGEENEK